VLLVEEGNPKGSAAFGGEAVDESAVSRVRAGEQGFRQEHLLGHVGGEGGPGDGQFRLRATMSPRATSGKAKKGVPPRRRRGHTQQSMPAHPNPMLPPGSGAAEGLGEHGLFVGGQADRAVGDDVDGAPCSEMAAMVRSMNSMFLAPVFAACLKA
jgi:hypothetical protein